METSQQHMRLAPHAVRVGLRHSGAPRAWSLNTFRVNMKHIHLPHLRSSLYKAEMAEAATAKPFEHPPSRIPVLSRRQSLNVEPLVLQQSSINNNGADGRPGSASGVHKRPSVSRRQSLLPNGPSRKSSFGDKSRDPGE